MENYLTQITNYLLTQSWQIVILVGVIAVINLALKNRNAHIRYLLWLIVLAKCLVPPLFTVPLAVLPEERPAVVVTMLDRSVAEPPVRPVTPVAVAQAPTIVERPARFNSRQWLVFGWVMGVAAFVIFAVIKALRTDFWLWRQRKRLSAELQTGIENLFSGLGIKTLPKVWLVEGIGQPFVWGLLRGSIYLPADFVKVNSAEHRRGVLGHELSHIIRFDAAVNILQIIAQAVFWFHPFVWWANKKIRGEREKCCDEMAIAHLGAKAKEYSSAIVNILISEHESTRPVPSLAVAGPVKNIEERIKTMLRPGKKFYKRPSLIAIIVLLLIALLAVPIGCTLTRRARTETATEREGEPTDSLHQAAAHGDIAQVKLLIGRGADVNAKDDKGQTPLHYAANRGHADVVELLITNGADANGKNIIGHTALHAAAVRGHKAVVEFLIAKGADLNATNKLGRTPLHWAARGGRREVVELLISKGADVNANDKRGKTPMSLAKQRGHSEIAALLRRHGAKDESSTEPAKAKSAATAALFRAIRDTNIERTRLAINQGADLEGKNKDEIFLIGDIQSIGCTPLYVAAGVPDANDNLIGLLLEAGANPNARDPRGQIPLHAAARGANISIVEMLVSAGSNVNARDKKGMSPAMTAFELGQTDKFDLMVAHGTTVSTDLMSAYKGNLSRVQSLIENGKAQERFEQGLTLLHAAAAGGHTAIVDLLLTNGLDVRSKTQAGYTALHHAAAGNHREAAELLLAKGADVNAEPGKQTPLHWAIGQQHKDMIDWLLARGANPNADGGDYWGTPLHWAVWWWDVDTALLLVSHGGDIHLVTQKYTISPLLDSVIQGHRAMAEALVTKTGDTKAAKWAPLHATVVSGDIQAVEDLLARGADVNAKSERGLSALHSASVFGLKDIVELLIEKGADVNAKAEGSFWDEGMTVLHGSCVKGQKGVAELLIAKGADVNAKSKNGYTPLHVAATQGYRGVAELLIAKGADINEKDNKEGRTALSLAKEHGWDEVVELLYKHGAKK